ncbi:putative bifunctional diguanylate cyclase/phosphodiesterase [Spiribacter vilamensis]|uniref:Diguanylate cyclase (GGDEF)-like protein n=1 Tax=Spiribacter vilamensis TaxID=531306 RepID=A0A4Q8D0C1_9GAMM|nr:bifunctional diguanylate cyclase/phosphodiesterase [Spiribacter vilamensis]RZU98733.1 diguanylate cyclase (GGDEF)-like protein [Spiribacter vilamensis]TVO62243.1 bifunctional diguanylate cyclase/phosphodiesterase [Spiribacter vilamensis]
MTDQNLDPLTGLANRIGMEKRLLELKDESLEQPVAVLLFALSRFSTMTDSIGSALGDKVISTIAKRLNKKFSSGTELIARSHGDHFCLLFTGEFDLNKEVEVVRDFIERPLVLRGEVIVLNVRFGAAESLPGSNISRDLLLHCAEVSLNRAKKSGKNYCLYDERYQEEAKAAHALENNLRVSLSTNHADLHRGIDNEEFQLYYHPIINTTENKIDAFEALIRWQHPTHGFILPDQFIPAAEKIQVMDVLGSWVLKKACTDAVQWPYDHDGNPIGVSINLSPTQFIHPEVLLNAAQKAISESGLSPDLVKLELTESSAFSQGMIATIEKLRDMGFRIALDDFGTGYSSLTQVNNLPLDYLKLDRSFVQKIGSDNRFESKGSLRMTQCILSLAATFELTPIVEGIENEYQLRVVRDCGANLIQGYYFSRPMPAAEVADYVRHSSESLVRA